MHIYINENMEVKREPDHYAIFMEGKKIYLWHWKIKSNNRKVKRR